MADDNAARVQELERSVESLESQLREQIARTRAGATTIIVVGILLVVVLLIVFYKFVNIGEIRKSMEPQNLVDSLVGATDADARISEIIKQMEQRALEGKTEVVTNLRERLMAQLPAARERLVALAEDQISQLSKTLDEKVDGIVQEILAEHQKELGDFIEAAKHKDAQRLLEEQFTRSLEELIGPSLDEYILNYNRWMGALDARLARLSQPEERLSPDERFEKQAIVKVLTFIDDLTAEQPPAPATAQ